MKTTFIVKNLTAETLDQIADMAPRDAYAKLHKWAYGDLRHCVSVKYGRGNFGCRVDWNCIIKSGKPVTFQVEPRKGYKLFTFTG